MVVSCAEATAAAEAAAVHVHEAEVAQLETVRKHVEQAVNENRFPSVGKFLQQVEAREALLSCKGDLIAEAQRIAVDDESEVKRAAVQELAKKGALLDVEAGKTLDPISILTKAANEARAKRGTVTSL